MLLLLLRLLLLLPEFHQSHTPAATLNANPPCHAACSYGRLCQNGFHTSLQCHM
jgi:hypothetical protein